MRFLRFLYSWSLLIPVTIFLSLVLILLRPIDLWEERRRISEGRLGRGGIWVKITYYRLMLWLHGVRVEVEGPGAPLLKKLKGVIFVANHQSLLDIPAIALAVGENASFLAKVELSRIPFFGWAAAFAGTLFIDRSKGHRNQSLESLNDFIQKGISVIMFPEGTRSSTGALLPFKRGAFVMAIQNQTAVVPLTIRGSRELCPKHALYVKPGVVRIYADLPVDTRGRSPDDRVALADQVKTLIGNHLMDGTPGSVPQ